MYFCSTPGMVARIENLVGIARVDQTARQCPGIRRLSGFWAIADATGRLDGLRARSAVGARPRQDHDDGLFLLLVRERAQKVVHRRRCPRFSTGFAENEACPAQSSACNPAQ
jgi:hypothetical protein